MQMIEEPVDPEDVQVILEAYLHVLEVAGQRELIALYAGALGANAIERYASFLASLGLSADPTERRTALARARTHGLDVPAVARKTAGLTLARALEVKPPACPTPASCRLSLTAGAAVARGAAAQDYGRRGCGPPVAQRRAACAQLGMDDVLRRHAHVRCGPSGSHPALLPWYLPLLLL